MRLGRSEIVKKYDFIYFGFFKMKDVNMVGIMVGCDFCVLFYIYIYLVIFIYKCSFVFVYCKVLSGFQVICLYFYGSMKVELNGNRMESYV